MKELQSYLIIFILLLSGTKAVAQVGIGTSIPHAQLDIQASNASIPSNTDGILIPRIATFPTPNPTVLQQGMLVFLTTPVGINASGFYYWNNSTSSWIGLGNTNNWSLLGNSGTSSTTNFIGTTNDQDLVIKRNNIKAGFIGNPNTTTGNMNTALGANSLLNPNAAGIRNTVIGSNVMPSVTSGNLNTSVGDQSMLSNTTGVENTAMGVGALYSNVNGNCNTAIGRNALVSNISGGSNTAVGYTALRNTTGNFNTAVGRDALRRNGAGVENSALGVNAIYDNQTGSYNTAIGVQALRNINASNNTGIGWQSLFSNISGNNNVAIGYQAGFGETGSNKLYIENSNANAVNALIYGEFDNNIARINGQLQIADPTTTGYNFPVARGTNKQVLETDAVGNLSWVNQNQTLSVVRTNLSADQALTTAGWQKIDFNTIVFDTATEFVTASNRFIANKAGYYQINAGYHIFGMTTSEYFSIAVYKNGAEYQESSANHVAGPIFRNINCIVSLAVGDYIEIYAQNYQTGATVDQFSGKTYFEINQIK
jgi:hypothetical protein